MDGDDGDIDDDDGGDDDSGDDGGDGSDGDDHGDGKDDCLFTVCWKFELLGSQEMIADVEVMLVACKKHHFRCLSIVFFF